MKLKTPSVTEMYCDQYCNCIKEIAITKRALEVARLDQMEDSSMELEQIIESMWQELHRLIDAKQDAYDMLIAHSMYAPWELEEMEYEILEMIDESSTEI